jgi:heme oxygenase (biliverdin-producing, ferredoxin)
MNQRFSENGVNAKLDSLYGAGTTEPMRASLGDMLRDATHALHVEAERSGVIGQLLRGGGTREAYALLLRNLSPAYRAMEGGLVRYTNSPALRAVVPPELFRTAALESDVERLAGAGWRQSLPLLPAGERYAERVGAAAANGSGRLVAHAYLRYLGDLSGGQIMKRLLAKSLGLGADALAFYDFPAIADLSAFKSEYRKAIDGSVVEGVNPVDVVDEAIVGFRLTIELSAAVARACPQ